MAAPKTEKSQRWLQRATMRLNMGTSLFICKKTNTLVCVCTDKVKLLKLSYPKGAEVIISDDGLQHYHLQEILKS
jgi:tetraacyldisaccharide-1-P 4'-kinase